MLLPNIDASTSLIYTAIILSPVSTAGLTFQGNASSDYFKGVKSIQNQLTKSTQYQRILVSHTQSKRWNQNQHYESLHSFGNFNIQC